MSAFDLTDRFSLPQDLVILSAGDVPPSAEKVVGADEVVLSLRHSRVPSKVVPLAALDFLQFFRTQHSIFEGIVEYSRKHGSAPESTLEQLFPLIISLVSSGYLRSSSTLGGELRHYLSKGDAFGEWTVGENIQRFDDTEVYFVSSARHGSGVLKIATQPSGKAGRSTLKREVEILEPLQGIGPRLFESGSFEGRSYFITEQLQGVSVAEWCERRRLTRLGQVAILHTVCDVIEAYARLHESGILHGDVHPKNVFVLHSGEIRLIDFGLSVRRDVDERVGRGGISYFLDPEFAAARLSRTRAPVVTEASEQFSLAAVVFFIITGHHYLPFENPERSAMLKAICSMPASSVGRYALSLAAIDDVLQKALAKAPEMRFESMARFSLEFRRSALRLCEALSAAPSFVSNAIERFVEDRFAEVQDVDAYLAGHASFPQCSITYGAAGVALAWLQRAQAKRDARFLSLADSWAEAACAWSNGAEAFYSNSLDLTADLVSGPSLFHNEPGLHFTCASIASARGDVVSYDRAVGSYIESCRRHGRHFDVTLGTAGLVLGTSLLMMQRPDIPLGKESELEAAGDVMCEQLLKQTEPETAASTVGSIRYFGIAHGEAGVLYASLHWYRSRRRVPPSSLTTRLAALTACGRRDGQHLRWPRIVGAEAGRRARPEYLTSWCNGTAGFVFLYCLAYEALRVEEYLEVALAAGMHLLDRPDDLSDLCCGSAGRSYSFMYLFNLTGDERWRQAAIGAIEAAISTSHSHARVPGSLYKGSIGVALSALNAIDPHPMSFPAFA